VSRWGAQRPLGFSFAAYIAGAAARPIATQGRSYKGRPYMLGPYIACSYIHHRLRDMAEKGLPV